jgi:hypothetical protein
VYRFYTSEILLQCCKKISFRYFRGIFQNQLLVVKNKPAGNPHAFSAADRSGADDTIASMITIAGLRTWTLSASPKDQWNEIDGERAVRGVRDMLLEPQDDPITDEHALKLIDVDYYLTQRELGDWLSYERPMLLYTWLPRTCFATGEDGCFYPNLNKFIFKSGGGGEYEHELWDWDIDNFTIYSSRIRRFIYVYVQVRRLDAGRGIVCLMPAMTFDPIFFAALPETYDVTKTLKRLKTSRVQTPTGDFYLMSSGAGDKTLISLYDTSCSAGYVMSLPHFTNAVSACRMSPSFTASTLQRIMGEDEPSYHLTTMIKAAAKTSIGFIPKPDPVDRPRLYTFAYSDVTDEPRNTGRVYMRPFIDGAFAPTSCRSNDLGCIQHRVLDVAASQTPPPRRFYGYRAEFVRQLVGVARGTLVPFSLEEVLDNATEKQRKKYQHAMSIPKQDRMEAFQKTEAYSEVKDPRNIINQDPLHVLHWSAFIQPAVEYLKNEAQAPWYAFGLTPRGLAERVHQLAATVCYSLLETDFSRYDGTLSYFLREVELLVLHQLFRKVYRHQISQLWSETLNQAGKTRFSVKFFLKSQRRSGSGETSWGNTLINAFVGFCCLRELGHPPKEAYAALGLYGGDDGISDLPRGAMEKTCKLVDLKVKPLYRTHGDPVSFLGRIWPEPATHCGSYIDPIRVLSKLHYVSSADPTIPRELHAWRKGVSLLATDSQTPLLGDIARSLMALGAPSRRTIQWDHRPHKAHLNELANAEMSIDALLERFAHNPVYPPIEYSTVNLTTFYGPIVDLFADLDAFNTWERKFNQWVAFPNFEPPLMYRPPVNAPSGTVDIEGLQVGPPMASAPKIPEAGKTICPTMRLRKCPPGCKGYHPKDACFDHFRGRCKRKRCTFKHY